MSQKLSQNLDPFSDYDVMACMTQRDDGSDAFSQFDWTIPPPSARLSPKLKADDTNLFWATPLTLKTQPAPTQIPIETNLERSSYGDCFASVHQPSNDLNSYPNQSLKESSSFETNLDDDCFGDSFIAEQQPPNNDAVYDSIQMQWTPAEKRQLSQSFPSKQPVNNCLQNLNDYNDAVNESIEMQLTPAEYRQLSQSCSSKLWENLLQQTTKLDDLEVGSSFAGTNKLTYTAIRSFNYWWQNHTFTPQHSLLYSVRDKFSHMVDGFQALCSSTHQERNILFSHFVSKMTKRTPNVPNEPDFVLGRTKQGYLNSLMRALKMYEAHHGLTHIYGKDWSWTKDIEYKSTFAALKSATTKNELQISPRKINHSPDFMSEEQWRTLHTFTFACSEDATIPFVERLRHKIAYFCQACVVYDCLRGREELANMTISEFSVLEGGEDLLFQMKRPFKSMKLDAHMKPTHKESLVIPGKLYVDLLGMLLQHRPNDLPDNICQRLLLRPKDKVTQFCQEWFERRVLGKEFTDHIVSSYVLKLHQQKHPLFLEKRKFTNTSLRKYHIEKLSAANAPLIVQQASLAQNTRHYARGAHDLETKKKVADVVSGKRKLWDEENVELPASSVKPHVSCTAMEHARTNTNNHNTPQPSSGILVENTCNKKVSFSFQAGNASINFSYDL
jgi:hypothetical protein